MRRNRRQNIDQYRSKCGEHVFTGTADHIMRAYEKLAYDAERARDDASAQMYFQHAEHWKREKG
jgi:hypothetical protein